MPIFDTLDRRSKPDIVPLDTTASSGNTGTLRDTFCPEKVRQPAERLTSVGVHIVFVISGIAALLYQLIWQRALLMLYGSNTESLAMVVAYRVNSTGNVGNSVSWLYFVNTLGGGIGAFLAGFVVLRHFGLAGSSQLAAGLNLFCASFVFFTWKLQTGSK